MDSDSDLIGLTPVFLAKIKALRIHGILTHFRFFQNRENLPSMKFAGKLLDVTFNSDTQGSEISIPGHSSNATIYADSRVK